MSLTAYTTVIHTANSSKESFHGFHFCLHQKAKFLRRVAQSPTSSSLQISDSVQQSAGDTVDSVQQSAGDTVSTSLESENWTKPK